jgi:hypothetical protein
MAPRPIRALGPGCMAMAQGRLGQYTTVFRAQVYVKACAVENLDRNYRKRNIYILSDNQAAIKALDNYQIKLKTGLGLPIIPRATSQS